MIALLSGELAYKAPDHVIVDTGGVGYRLFIPLSSFYALPDHGRVRLHVHTHVTDDAIRLFGFLTREEKEMFTLLLGVSGVGPKLAVNILSGIPVGELRLALSQADIKRLSAIPGIGRKTAERLVLELRDKVGALEAATPAAIARPAATGSALDDALSALVNLGYKEPQARKALAAVETAPGAALEDILKAALRVLTR